MLDRLKVTHALTQWSGSLSKKIIDVSWLTPAWWQTVTSEEAFLQQVEEKRDTHSFPWWLNEIHTLHSVQENKNDAYSILAVDGSQIYPDKHQQNLDFFLLNTGSCFIHYGKNSTVSLATQPYVIAPAQYRFLGNIAQTDLVDLIREEKEFCVMQEQATKHNPALTLFDGNLLLWHMEYKNTHCKDYFIPLYLAPLMELYQKKQLVAGYLSAPRFNDIVTMLNVALSSFYDKKIICDLEDMTDADLFSHLLQPGQRSPVFIANHAITRYYEPPIKPCFLYLNTESEIIRLEIPSWIAHDKPLVDTVCALCIDQCQKGQGYPVVLAESHAQAVIQTADRDFFYHVVAQQLSQYYKRQGLSPKSFKKRYLTV
jgi:hypothetical protein